MLKASFTQQEPIPEEAIAHAVEVMRSGRLHRYNSVPGVVAETALLEQEFRDYMGSKYCLAVASGGYALTTALRAMDLQPGAAVLTNGFTLSPVPGAIVAAQGRPVLVETTEDLTICLYDLAAKIKSSGARALMLSHMRGHIVDMDALMALCNEAGVLVIEDCAHTMGASYNGVKSGRHGHVGCYSTQTYKHINSGEGGLLVSDDPALMARATILSGSYMLYGRHPAGPPEDVFENIRLQTPNCSGRMDNLRAAILRPQLCNLDDNVRRWNERYQAVADKLSDVTAVKLPVRAEREYYVGSSIQFLLPDFSAESIGDLLARCIQRGVELKWFGEPQPVAYTSSHQSWRFLEAQSLPRTDEILKHLCDMRLPLTFSLNDCRLIGTIIRDSIQEQQRYNPLS